MSEQTKPSPLQFAIAVGTAMKAASEFQAQMQKLERAVNAAQPTLTDIALLRARLNLMAGRARFVAWGGRERDIQVGSDVDRRLQVRR